MTHRSGLEEPGIAVDVDCDVPDAVIMAIGDIDGVPTVRNVRHSELAVVRRLSD